MATTFQMMVLELKPKGMSETEYQMRKLSERLNEFKQRAEQAEKQLAKLEARQKMSSSAMGGMIKSLAGMAAGYLTIRQVITTLTDAYTAFDQQQQGIRLVSNQLEETGRAAEISIVQLREFSSELQKISNYEDDQILKEVYGTLLAFNNIPTDKINDIAKAVMNLAAYRGLNLKQAAEIYGRALEDPLTATRQLRTAGILLSQTQKDLMRDFAEAGKGAEAQTALIDILTNKYVGASEASMTAAGDMKKSWQNFLDELGKFIAPGINKILDQLTKAFNGFNEASGFLSGKKAIDKMGILEVHGALMILDNQLRQHEILYEDYVSLSLQYEERIKALGYTLGKNNELIKIAAKNTFQYTTKVKKQTNALKEQKEEIRTLIPEYENLAQIQDYVYDNMLKNLNEISKATVDALQPKERWFDEFKTTWKDFGADFADMINNQIAGALSLMVLSHENAANKLKRIWNSLVSSLINELARYAAALLIFNFGKMLITGGTSALFNGSGVDLIPSVPMAGYNGGMGSGATMAGNMPTISNTMAMNNKLLNAIATNNNRPIINKVYVDPKDIYRASRLGESLSYTVK